MTEENPYDKLSPEARRLMEDSMGMMRLAEQVAATKDLKALRELLAGFFAGWAQRLRNDGCDLADKERDG